MARGRLWVPGPSRLSLLELVYQLVYGVDAVRLVAGIDSDPQASDVEPPGGHVVERIASRECHDAGGLKVSNANNAVLDRLERKQRRVRLDQLLDIGIDRLQNGRIRRGFTHVLRNPVP